MSRTALIAFASLLAMGFAAAHMSGPATAQDAAKPKKAVAAKSAAPGMKTCKYKFPGGEQRSWTCKKEEPCCAWDAIKYVKCGSTITGCL